MGRHAPSNTRNTTDSRSVHTANTPRTHNPTVGSVPVAEIRRAAAGLEFTFVSGLQSNLNKAFTLADGAGFHNNPGYFQVEYQKLLAVTTADVKRVANKYLTRGRVVLSVVPMGKLDQASKPSESKKVEGAQ